MGSKITLSSSFTAATGKTLQADAIMPAAGALILVDVSHSAGGIGSGVPVNGAAIPNVAWEQAAAMLGSGTANTLASAMVNKIQAADGTGERTPKGGLHVAMRRDTNTNNDRGAYIDCASAIKSYVLANYATHQFYLSLWSRLTRAALSGGNRKAVIGYGGKFAIEFDLDFVAGGTSAVGPNSLLGSRHPGNVVGNWFYNGANPSWYGSAPVNVTEAGIASMIWGNVREGAAAWNNKASSDVFYRSYVEDLTVSGRTYAEVDAIDYALWQAAFAAGGKFYGDTFTNPATLAGA